MVKHFCCLEDWFPIQTLFHFAPSVPGIVSRSSVTLTRTKLLLNTYEWRNEARIQHSKNRAVSGFIPKPSRDAMDQASRSFVDLSAYRGYKNPLLLIIFSSPCLRESPNSLRWQDVQCFFLPSFPRPLFFSSLALFFFPGLLLKRPGSDFRRIRGVFTFAIRTQTTQVALVE